jgi:hypothetical protein
MVLMSLGPADPIPIDQAGSGYAPRVTVVGADLPPSTAPAAAWRRPPLSVPAGRSPSSGRSLAILGVLFFFYVYYVAGSATASILAAEVSASWSGIVWPAALPLLVICVAGVGYELAVIATAGRPRVRLTMRDWGLGGSPAAKVWLGLAYLLPLAASLVADRVFLAAPLAGAVFSPLSWLVRWLGPAAFAICLILARVCSLRAVKHAILNGRAPSFRISSDEAWWWDGQAWTNVSDAAPETALHSPDDNYWWTGQDWIPLPPRP